VKTFDLNLLDFKVHNGGCIENAFLELRDQGLVLVRGENLDEGGSNGSGKTTLFDLLSTTLTGSSGKGARKNDYLPLWGGKDLELVLRFEHGGNSYVVNNYRKHSVHGTRIQLLENGVDITPTTKIDDVQKMVLERSGITEREWYGSVYLTQQHSHSLITGTPKEKKAYLAAHFGLDNIDACIKVNEKWVNGIQLPDDTVLKELLTTCEEQLRSIPEEEVLRADIAQYTSRAQDLSKRMVDVGVEIRNYEQARGAEANRRQHVQTLARFGYQIDQINKAAVDALRARIRQAESAASVLHSRATVEAQLQQLEAGETPEALQAEMADVQRKLTVLKDVGQGLNQRAYLESKLTGIPDVTGTLDEVRTSLMVSRKQLSKLEARSGVLQQEIQNLRKLEDKCPVCLRSITKQELEDMVSQREKSMSEYTEVLPQVRDMVRQSEIDLRHLEERIKLMADLEGLPVGSVEQARIEYEDLRSKLTSLTQQIATATTRKRLVDQLSSMHIPDGVDDIPQIPYLNETLMVVSAAYDFVLRFGDVRFSEEGLALAQQTQADLQAQHTEATARMSELTAQLHDRQRLVQQASDIQRQVQKASAEKQRKRVLEVLQVVLKDVKAKALRDCTEMIRSALPLYVRQLFPNGDVSVELAEEEDSLDFYLKKSGQQIPMSLVSGGQAKRIGLAVLFAFAKLGAKTTNVLITDEPYKDLDAIGRACAFELLQDLGIPSIFVTSHDQDQLSESRYDKVLVMRMQNGRSQLIY
jgi:DNA repair exonuclease SbcCD ATPase subunit